MKANCRSEKGLRAKCTDYVSTKTKPISPAGQMVGTAQPYGAAELPCKTKPICGPVGRGREPVMRNKANLRGLLVGGLACKTKPISLAGRMVCTAHPAKLPSGTGRKCCPVLSRVQSSIINGSELALASRRRMW